MSTPTTGRRPATAGLIAPGPFGRVGDVVEVWFKNKEGALVVGEVVRADDESFTVEDHDEKRWTALREEVRLQPAKPKSERVYRWRRVRIKRDLLIKQVLTAVQAAEPLRPARPGEASNEHFEVIGTAVGAYVWPRRRAPRAQERREWAEKDRAIRKLSGEVELLEIPATPIAAGKFIPSRIEVSNMLALDGRRLLGVDELRVIERWHDFWLAHPEADIGVVGDEGQIIPRSYATRAGTRGEDPEPTDVPGVVDHPAVESA